MRIALDGMGGDHAPAEIVAGAIEAARQLPQIRLILVGRKDVLQRPDLPSNIEILHASEVVEMKEEPVKALLGKPDSSLRNCLRLVKSGQADGLISAGNTGALVGGAIFPLKGLGNLEGVKRPGIAVPFPTAKGYCALIDAGANPNAKSLHLIQYAVMGAVYIKYLRPEIGVPKVGLLNIGEEPKKGTDLQRETYLALQKTNLNFDFIGNVEPHVLLEGKADVVVCDGYTGNLALKMAEGVSSFIFDRFENGMADNPVVAKTRDSFDHSEHGGAPVLGCRGIVIKSHGRSKARAITNAIKLTAGFIQGRLNEHIVEELSKLSYRGGAWYSKLFNWSKDTE
jgi:phosphate acyltransferase